LSCEVQKQGCDLEQEAGYLVLVKTTAPILAGAVWDFGGAWPAYLVGTAWGAF